ncbi:MAG: 3-phosphoshikimate 1-carboxyvinyltransferase [Ignavibacteriales bacterium]|nr:MAG: 3-phosphoshikimate 1-carboxyvinyltransferase [Ignavibacteriales bacterium]
MIQQFNQIKPFSRELELPGDKSISHRAAIFSAMAKGKSVIKNISNGEDVNSTIECLNKIGTEFSVKGNEVIVDGCGYKGFKKPFVTLYAGNSGTTARLLVGLLSVQNFYSEITGDESLLKRPMDRVIHPLKEMNAKLSLSGNALPIKISPADNINSIDYKMPVASAQVKTSVILSGLHSDDESKIIEPVETRDHTERMLGLTCKNSNIGKEIFFSRKDYPVHKEFYCPSDFSTASFFIVLTLLNENSELRIKNVTLNPTRTGLLNILLLMGADIKFENENIFSGEPFGDIIVKSSELKNVEVPENIIPNIIDEVPILSVAAVFAKGDFNIRGAGELRLKESDRIKSIVHNLSLLGLDIEEYEDGFSVSGTIKKTNGIFNSFGDHRIAMAFSILSLLLNSEPNVNNFECVNISNPDFIAQLSQLQR